MVKAGIVARRIIFNSRPRPVYEIEWSKIEDIISVPHTIKACIDKLLNTLRNGFAL